MMGIQITKEQSGYSAYLPEYRIHTQGENFEELIMNLKEAVSMYSRNLIISKKK